MSGLPCSSSYSQPSAGCEAACPGDPPGNLEELLGHAVPPVKDAVRVLLGLDIVRKKIGREGQVTLRQQLAAARTSSPRRLGREELSDLVFNSSYILNATALAIFGSESPDDARSAASTVLLQPAPARAALVRLLAAMLRWEPGLQLPATSGVEQQEGQPAAMQDSDQPSDAEGREPRGGAEAVASAAAAEQRQRPEVRLAQRLLGLQNGVCRLVCELLAFKSNRLPQLVSSDMPRLLLSLDFGCALLQTHVPQCLSRQLATASKALLVQLPPEAAAAASEPMQGQQQHQGEGDQQGRERGPSPAQHGTLGHAAAASAGGAAELLHAAWCARNPATVLAPSLCGLMSLAADACYCSSSPAAAGSGSSTGPGPSQGPQQPDAAGHKQLRQLSRRYLLCMAGGLRDSHLFDHWARELLLSALCEAEDRGGVEVGGEKEEGTACGVLTQAATAMDNDGEERSEGGVSGEAGQAVANRVAAAAVGSKRQEQNNQHHHLQQQQQQQQQGLISVGDEVFCIPIDVVADTLHRLREARSSSASNPQGSPPLGLCAALQQALSGPCTQHLTLALGTLLLHEADGGSLYGMPPPYCTGTLASALTVATQNLLAPSCRSVQLLHRSVCYSFLRLLTDPGSDCTQHLPTVPPERHVDLLLRLGQLAVRSAQVYGGQEGGMGPRGVVIAEGDLGAVALHSLRAARTLLSSSDSRASEGRGSASGARAGAVEGAEADAAGGVVGGAGGGEGAGGAGAAGTSAATAQAGCPPGHHDAAATAKRRAACAAVAAEMRWHRLLLDVGLWVEMEEQGRAVWAQAWNHLERLGQLDENTGAMPPSAPTPVAGALAAGVLPCVERVLRRQGQREAGGGSRTAYPRLLDGLLRYECHWWPALGWLLAYGDVREGAAFMATLRKLAAQQHEPKQRRRRERMPGDITATTTVIYGKLPPLLRNIVKLSQQAGAAGDSGISSSGGGGGDSGGDGDGDGGGSGGGGGVGFTAVAAAQAGTAGMDSPGLRRLQLLLWYGVRQLLPPLAALAVADGVNPPGCMGGGAGSEGANNSLMSDVLIPVAVMALQIASYAGGGSSIMEGSDSSSSGDGGGSGGGSSTTCSISGNAGEISGSSSSSPPAWLSSWRRVLLEEWRAVELVGSALEQLVPALCSAGDNVVVPALCSAGDNVVDAIAKVDTLQSLVTAVCSVALAFPDHVWTAAGAAGAGAQEKERQAKGGIGSGSSRSSSRSGGGKRGAPAPAPSLPVWVWPTAMAVQLMKAVRSHIKDTGYTGFLELELDALSKLVALVMAGGPELPYKYDMPFVRAALKLKADSHLVGRFRWLCGEGPSPELLDGLLRTCSYPACASLEGDSEAGEEGRLVACGRGCGGAWYCCQACAEKHWGKGHQEVCGRGAAAAQGRGGAGGSGSGG